MPNLRDLRKQFRNLKSDFEREMEMEFVRRSAVLQDQIDREVWRLRFDEDMSIAKIGEQYGTKNYGTIKEIIDRRPEKRETETPEFTLDVTKQGNVYTVNDGTYVAVFDVVDPAYTFFHGDGTTPLADRIRKDDEFRTYIVNSVA